MSRLSFASGSSFTEQINFARSGGAKGLTLIELVVVLAILAVLAGVAVRSLEPIADQSRYEATLKTLESVKNAIVEDRIQSNGTRHVSGFVSDVGRLPESTWMLIDSTGSTPFFFGGETTTATQNEPITSLVVGSADRTKQLTVRNALFSGLGSDSVNVPEYRLAMHIVDGPVGVLLSSFSFADRIGPAASTPPANPTTVDCSGVSLRCGWRGPYLTVTDPVKGVVDGWGREVGLGSFPSQGDDVHVTWEAVTDQHTDQAVNVQRLSLQTVSGIIQDPSGAAKVSQVVLVYPDLTLSTSTLSVMADADGNDNDNRFRFDNVPVGVRALVFKNANGIEQAVRYIEVTPMQQANLAMSITEF